jgi:D-alanyl-D-alanine carboxypeptidase
MRVARVAKQQRSPQVESAARTRAQPQLDPRSSRSFWASGWSDRLNAFATRHGRPRIHAFPARSTAVGSIRSPATAPDASCPRGLLSATGDLRERSIARAVRRLAAGAGNGTVRGRLAPTDSPASILAAPGGALDAGSIMRAHPRSIILAAALLAPAAALTAACGDAHHAAAPSAAKSPTRTAAVAAPAGSATRPTLASQLRGVVDAGSPGVIALVNDGNGVRLHAAGVADNRSGRALRPSDRFRAGSNTKTFVATVALQLVGEHRLALSDTVEHWLPGVLPYGDQVNVRQLLNMTGGVPDYVPGLESKMAADRAYLSRSYSPRELVAMVGDKPDFAAGTSWKYSTTSYVLAGMIIERATGNNLAHELEHRIFDPLRMRDTYLPGSTAAIRGSHSNGYGELQGKLRDLTAFNASAGWAGGGAVTTAADMARFWRGLLGGRLLAPAQLAAMKTTVPVDKGYPGRYGLGLLKFTQYAKTCGVLWGNGGDLPGFSSEFYNSEDGTRQAGVIVNVNPIPKAVSGEPLGASKATAVADALGHEHC